MATKNTKAVKNNGSEKKATKAVPKQSKSLLDQKLITQRSKFADTSTIGSYAKNKAIMMNEKATPEVIKRNALEAIKNSSKTKEGYYKMQPSKISETTSQANYYGSSSPSNPKLARNPARLARSEGGLAPSTKLRMKRK